jgi:hypothetical protein
MKLPAAGALTSAHGERLSPQSNKSPTAHHA